MTPVQPTSQVSRTLSPFGTTIFAEMTQLAVRHAAVNLAQGFPDFDGPQLAKRAAIDAIEAGHAQYARMIGVPTLNEAIAHAWRARTGLEADPDVNITVTSGCTEAIPASVLGVVSPGDEVVVFEPFYDSYRACVALAGATARFVRLRPEAPRTRRRGFVFDPVELRRAFSPKTRAVLINTPHNPTGKVFTRSELEQVAELCVRHDAIAICDEVYEHLTYDDAPSHVSLATMPGMKERTITLGSLGKSYNLTGWKVGWAIAPENLTKGVRAAHQFLTFATATPMQHGAAAIIRDGRECIDATRSLFQRNRDALSAALEALGFDVFRSDGTYFVMADHTPISVRLGRDDVRDDRGFCAWLTREIGVASIPPSAFYSEPDAGRSFVRFAYCKKESTIAEAIARLEKLRHHLPERASPPGAHVESSTLRERGISA
ncbi:MAG: aminotransferase class I/II-fold pyridoxal phosphate-dependent enzyme [Planctomycetota bacterium]|nr:aminotransferase class I/II-fold pyridoxal phosphate-dependent enzyme [Planctomycetota bacterium]